MALEAELINYGVLGIWTFSLLIDKYKSQKKMQEVIENNTAILTLIHHHIHDGKVYKE